MGNPRSGSLATLCTSILAAACANGGHMPAEPSYANAVATPECAPWDGPAFQVVLADSAIPDPRADVRPSIVIRVYRSPSRAAGESIRIEGAETTGAILSCPKEGECVPARSGVVRVLRFQNDTMFGQLDATWPDSGRVVTPFRASWRDPGDVYCG